jgi:hyperosmotically inducible periplasmic protein
MARGVKAFAMFIGIAMLAAGCQTVAGQRFGETLDDRTTHAAVKTRLAADQVQSLTWVGVTSQYGVVYLTGTAESEAQRQRAQEVARETGGVREVVNHIVLQGEDPVAMAQAAQRAIEQARGARVPAAMAPPARSPAAREFRGEAPAAAPALRMGHTLTGEVRSIDMGTGRVTLSTPQGDMQVFLPQQQLQDLRQGDRVTVEMVLRPN